jgi:hypothetical protein
MKKMFPGVDVRAQCLLYEQDPGPAELNTGTAGEIRMVPRA